MKKFFILSLALAGITAYAQQEGRVGINTEEPKATLDVVGKPDEASAADGVKLPTLTKAQLNAKTSYGAEQRGTIVYVYDASGDSNEATANVNVPCVYVFDGTVWNSLGCSAPKELEEFGPGCGSGPYKINLKGKTHIADYEFANMKAEDYIAEGDGVCIPNTVISIGKGAFQNNVLGRLIFATPSTLQSIGDEAFDNAGIEGRLELPKNTTIGKGSFSNNKITSVTLPNIECIPELAFYNNELTSIKFPTSVKCIEAYAFGDNLLSNELIIPAHITSIGNAAFVNNQLSIVNMSQFTSDGLNGTLGAGIFVSNKITYIIFNANLKYIPEEMFAQNNISDFRMKTANQGLIVWPTAAGLVIDVGAFHTNPLNKAWQIYLPDNVVEVRDDAFGTRPAAASASVKTGTKLAARAFPTGTPIIWR